jgi:hypothetical protein
MKSFVRVWVSLFALAVAVAACGSPPPPVEPVPTAAPTEEPPPEPPPKKCESLDEGCKAKIGTAAKIAGSDYVLQPPKGWIYARLDKATVAQIDTKSAVLAIVGYEPDPKAPAAKKQRDTKLAELAELVGVQLPAPKTLPAKADQTKKKGDFTLLSWQWDKAKRGDEQGALLVLSAEQSGRVLLGLGFVPENDSSNSDAGIMSAFDSIEKGSSSSEGSSKESSDKSSEGGADKDKKGSSKDKTP